MIKEEYLFPQYFVNKIPICDDCNEPLKNTNQQLLSNPPLLIYKCPKCNKEYYYKESEIRGEWKWKTI